MSPLFQLVVVVVCEDQVQPGLARLALRNRWPILDLRSVQPIFKHVLWARPHLVVVQVPPPGQPVFHEIEHLVSTLSQHWNPISILAIVSESTSESEAFMRRAGADCFVSGNCSDESLASIIESMKPDIIGQSQRSAISPSPASSGGQMVQRSAPRPKRAHK